AHVGGAAGQRARGPDHRVADRAAGRGHAGACEREREPRGDEPEPGRVAGRGLARRPRPQRGGAPGRLDRGGRPPRPDDRHGDAVARRGASGSEEGMSASPTTAEPRPSPLRWLGQVLFRSLFQHWGLKALALALAAFMFVVTRDEVTRVFTVPLRVVEDSDRVLLTELPETIQVQARGPWTRVNRLQDYDFGVAILDLENARPGPLEVDRAAIVMPSGVVLAGIQYDHVDLR